MSLMHCYSNVSKSIKIKLILKNIRNKKCIIYCILDYKKRFDKGIILLIPKMFFFLFFACSVSALFQLLHIKYTASHCQNIMKKKPRFLFVFFSILPFLRILRNYWNISISLYNENRYSKSHFYMYKFIRKHYLFSYLHHQSLRRFNLIT